MNKLAGSARWARITWQTAGIAMLWSGCDWAVRRFGLPVPSGVLGLAVLLALLLSGAVGLGKVREGANWLLSEMLLFFIPATIAVVQYGGLLRADGWRLAVVVVAGTASVMLAVACAVDLTARFERRLAVRRARAERLQARATARAGLNVCGRASS